MLLRYLACQSHYQDENKRLIGKVDNLKVYLGEGQSTTTKLNEHVKGLYEALKAKEQKVQLVKRLKKNLKDLSSKVNELSREKKPLLSAVNEMSAFN